MTRLPSPRLGPRGCDWNKGQGRAGAGPAHFRASVPALKDTFKARARGPSKFVPLFVVFFKTYDLMIFFLSSKFVSLKCLKGP